MDRRVADATCPPPAPSRSTPRDAHPAAPARRAALAEARTGIQIPRVSTHPVAPADEQASSAPMTREIDDGRERTAFDCCSKRMANLAIHQGPRRHPRRTEPAATSSPAPRHQKRAPRSRARTGLSLAWRSSHRRPRSRRCWCGRAAAARHRRRRTAPSVTEQSSRPPPPHCSFRRQEGSARSVALGSE